MNIATLRIEGSDESLARIKEALTLRTDAEWEKGSKGRKGHARKLSGFNATVIDAKNRNELERSVRVFLGRCQDERVSFPSMGLSAELDIGLGVGAAHQYTAGVAFGPLDLAVFAQIGLELSISAYPCPDGPDDEECET